VARGLLTPAMERWQQHPDMHIYHFAFCRYRELADQLR
jgi:hypothetical protein